MPVGIGKLTVPTPTQRAWTESASHAVAEVATSVASSTATGKPEIAQAGMQVVQFITNNFLIHPSPTNLSETQVAAFQKVAENYEQSAIKAGQPETYIFKLRQDRENALKGCTTLAAKGEVWVNFVAGLGKVVGDWTNALNPLTGGSDKG